MFGQIYKQIWIAGNQHRDVHTDMSETGYNYAQTRNGEIVLVAGANARNLVINVIIGFSDIEGNAGTEFVAGINCEFDPNGVVEVCRVERFQTFNH